MRIGMSVISRRPAVALAACLAAVMSSSVRPAAAQAFIQDNLVTNNQAINPAAITDANLRDAWGVSFSPTGSPFWVSDRASGKATLYSVNPTTNATTRIGAIVVTIPGAGNPTGQDFNGNSAAFNGDPFLFVSLDGTVSGWRGALGLMGTAETFVPGSPSNSYTGSAIATISGNTYLYGANFKAGTIDVFKGTAAQPNLTGTFVDPSIPAGFAPFNIQNLGGTLFVAYAKQSATSPVGTPGVGNGFVDAYDLQGNFIARIATQGDLNSPWGLAIAPSSFGSFASDLLVGDFGDGRINAYDLSSNLMSDTFVGQLSNPDGTPFSIGAGLPGLWMLTVGNNGSGGSANKLYFSAGPNRTNGLFGIVQAVPEPSSLALLPGLLLPIGWLLRRRRS